MYSTYGRKYTFRATYSNTGLSTEEEVTVCIHAVGYTSAVEELSSYGYSKFELIKEEV